MKQLNYCLTLLLLGVFSTAYVQESDPNATNSSLDRYYDLLIRYPKLKYEGDLNDHTKGTYEIIYDGNEIQRLQKECYQRLYDKNISQGMTPKKAHEAAADFSRVGVVCEDQYWIWIRDAVISPSGFRHTYNRMIQKADLDRVGGAATLPIIRTPEGDIKLVLHLEFRHATHTWEFEIVRGFSNEGEDSLATARREVKEETGCEIGEMTYLGVMNPDSGMVSSVIPIYLGEVISQGPASLDQTEAIKGKYLFSRDQVEEGLKRGYIEIDLNGNSTRVNLRDPFLTYALLLARLNQKI